MTTTPDKHRADTPDYEGLADRLGNKVAPFQYGSQSSEYKRRTIVNEAAAALRDVYKNEEIQQEIYHQKYMECDALRDQVAAYEPLVRIVEYEVRMGDKCPECGLRGNKHAEICPVPAALAALPEKDDENKCR